MFPVSVDDVADCIHRDDRANGQAIRQRMLYFRCGLHRRPPPPDLRPSRRAAPMVPSAPERSSLRRAGPSLRAGLGLAADR